MTDAAQPLLSEQGQNVAVEKRRVWCSDLLPDGEPGWINYKDHCSSCHHEWDEGAFLPDYDYTMPDGEEVELIACCEAAKKLGVAAK